MSVDLLFLDVDTQHDFIDADGALAVPGAPQLVSILERLTQFARERRIPILADVDAHVPDDVEFEQFPPHGVAGTPGQKKIPQTLLPGAETVRAESPQAQIEKFRRGRIPQLIIEKQTLDVFAQPVTEVILSALDPERVIVYGVATEYCVRCAVLGLRERHYTVTLVTDAIAAVDPGAGEKALAEMQAAGAVLDTAESVRRSLE